MTQSTDQHKSPRPLKKVLLKIVVSTLLIGVIFWKVDKESLIANLRLLDLKYAPVIILLLVLNYVFSSMRWKKLLIHGNSDHVSLRYLIGLYFIGSFFNNFMPTSIGGDVFKVYKLGQKMGNTTDAFSATFMERFSGVVALLVISSVSMVNLLGWLGVLLFAAFWAGSAVGLVVLKYIKNKVKILASVYDSLIKYKDRKDIIAYALVTSFLVQLCSIFTQYFVYTAVGVSLPLFYSLLVFPAIILASFFIPSLNGIGVQDALYMQLFAVVGVGPALSLAASILFHLFKLMVSLFGGILYAAGKAD